MTEPDTNAASERERIAGLVEMHLNSEKRCHAEYGRSLVANHAYTAELLELLLEDIRNGAHHEEQK